MRTAPLSKSTRLSLPVAKKPTRRLSGDQKGSNAPSVPLICCAFDDDNVRIQSLSLPSGPTATNARRVASGEMEKLLCSNDQLDGGSTEERIGRRSWSLVSFVPRRECNNQPKKNERKVAV